MKRDFLKELELSDDQIDSIMKEHGKSINEVKAKADKVDTLESQVADYEQQIKDRDKQLKDLEAASEGNEDLKKQIKDLQDENENVKKDFDTKLQQQRKEAKLELALKDAKAKNPKAVKALLDAEKVSLDGDNLIGLEEQLSALKESDAYLFGEDEPKGLKGREPHPSDPNKQPAKDNPFSKESFNMTEQGKLIRSNPDEARTLIKQAGGNPAIYGL